MLLARFYDAIWSSTLPDETYLRQLISETTGPVVDLGCATGRVLAYAKETGRKVIGIDQYPEMLERANESLGRIPHGSHQLICGDFSTFPISESVGLITCVANTFSMIIGSSIRKNLLEKAAKHLLPDGKIAIWIVNDSEKPVQSSSMIVETKSGTLYFYRHVLESKEKRTRHYNLEFKINDLSETYPFTTELISVEEMNQHAKSANLKISSLTGNFDGSIYNSESPMQIYIMENE